MGKRLVQYRSDSDKSETAVRVQYQKKRDPHTEDYLDLEYNLQLATGHSMIDFVR